MTINTNKAHYAEKVGELSRSLSDTSVAIDEELRKVEGLARVLREHRNEVVPAIANLPLELLAKIFLELQEEGISDVDVGPGAICVSHVCRIWRGVALSTASLWATLKLCRPVPSSAFLEGMMERTKAAPLSVKILPLNGTMTISTKEVNRCKEISRILAPHAFRLKYLSVVSGGIEGMQSLLTQTTPILHQLELETHGLGFNLQLDIPSNLPRLAVLKLTNTRLPLSTSPHSNLTSFKLTVMCDNDARYASTTSLLQALVCMPLLQSLFVDQHLHSTSAGETTTLGAIPRVQLPHLKSLSLSLHLIQLQCVLNALSFPPLESSAVTSYGRYNDNDRWTAEPAMVDTFFTLLSTKPTLFPTMSTQRTAFFHVEPTNATCFSFIFNYGDGLEISLYKSIMSPDLILSDWPTPTSVTPYRVAFLGQHDYHAQSAFWQGAKTLFSLHLFPSMRMSGAWSLPVWDDISTLPVLSTVVIDEALSKHGDDLDQFLTASGPKMLSRKNNPLDSSVQVPFPSLERLWIGLWPGKPDYKPVPDLPNPDRIATLAGMLSQRSHLGMKPCAVAILNPPNTYQPLAASWQQLEDVASDLYFGHSEGLDNPFK